MPTSTTFQPPTVRKVYYLRWRKVYLFWAGYCLLIAFFAFRSATWPGKDIEDRCGRIFDMFWLLWMALLWYGIARRTHLIISPDGIEYYTLYYGIHTTWDNIGLIGRIPWHLSWHLLFHDEGLVLHQPALRGNKWLTWIIPTPLYRFVPLSPFAKQWRDSELGQDIKQYAPHLFAQEQRKS